MPVDLPATAEASPARAGLAGRFVVTLVATLLRAALAFVSGAILARSLGPAEFGDLMFLLSSFVAVAALLDLGSSSAFYTFVSQRRRPARFFTIYLLWVLAQFVIALVIVGLALPRPVLDLLWTGHERHLVLLALVASFLTSQVWGILNNLGEAVRKTVVTQSLAAGQAAVHVVAVWVLHALGWLRVETALGLLVVEYALMAALVGPWLLRANLGSTEPAAPASTTLREFARFCRPLVLHSWLGFAYIFGDRWMLQHFGGAEQQGYYAFGQQVANVALLAAVSVLKVLWKEVAEARARGDMERVRVLFHKVSRGVFCAGAFVACLLVPYGEFIIVTVLGDAYAGGALALTIMLLYPVHQGLGQVQGTLLYASEQPGAYARIAIFTMALSVPVTYLLLGPRDALIPGLALGAVGLSVKLVSLQLVEVNLQSRFIAKSNGWPSSHRFQFAVLGVFLSLSFGAKWVVGAVTAALALNASQTALFMMGAGFYALAVGALLALRPGVAGFDREEVRSMIRKLGRRGGPPEASDVDPSTGPLGLSTLKGERP